MISANDVIFDLPMTIVLLLWVIFVVYYIARWTYNYAVSHGRSPHSATYFGRKVIHFLAGGLVAFYFHSFLKNLFFP
jgi:hypothetical protein